MTIFETYLDPSYDDGDSNVYVVAGFTADAQRWALFDLEWQRVLDQFEIPAFHMKDFESGYGAFEGWGPGDSRRIPLLQALAKVIDHCTVAAVAYGAPHAAYAEALAGDVAKVVGGSPYWFLFVNLVVNTQILMDNAAKMELAIPQDWRMIYMLARGDKGAGAIAQSWMSREQTAEESRTDTRTIGVYIAQNNGAYRALEAADWLAFECRKQIGLQLGHHTRGPRKSLALLQQSRRPSSVRFVIRTEDIEMDAEIVRQVTLGRGELPRLARS